MSLPRAKKWPNPLAQALDGLCYISLEPVRLNGNTCRQPAFRHGEKVRRPCVECGAFLVTSIEAASRLTVAIERVAAALLIEEEGQQRILLARAAAAAA